MLHFLLSEDWFRVHEREQELVTDFQKRFPDARRALFDGAENFGLQELQEIQELSGGGLFSTPQVIVLRQVGEVEENLIKKLKEILDLASEKKDMLVITHHIGKGKKTHPLVAWLLKKAKSEELKALPPAELRRYGSLLLQKIDTEASIEPRALDVLIANSKDDTGKLFQELTKLALFRKGKKITFEDVTSMTEAAHESNVFAAFDRLVQGRREESLILLRSEEKDDVPIQKTLGLCAWQLRRLIEIHELSEGGRQSVATIARELKAAPFMVQKILPQMKYFPLERLKQGVTLLADIDKSIRLGKIQPGVALDLFIWKF